jgi:hypothetical protein
MTNEIEVKDSDTVPRIVIELMDMLIDSGGEYTPEFIERMKSLGTKVDKIDYFIDFLESQYPLYEKRIEKINKTKEACEKLVDALKNNLVNAMLTLGVDELDGEMSRVKLSTSKGAVVTTKESEKLIPKEYLKEIITVTHPPDKTKIRAALENFESVPGAELVYKRSVKFYTQKAGKKAISE